jgi:3-oxoacyl-[acyl-carrier-protein] synthase II
VEVVVTGIGLASALGLDLQTNWDNLLLGRSGIQPHQPIAEQEQRPLGLLANRPSSVDEIRERVVAAALRDANLKPPLMDCGVVIGSSRGYQAQWESLARRFRQPMGLTPEDGQVAVQCYSQPVAVSVRQQVGGTGPVLAPMAACATGLWAIAQGADLIRAGQCQRVVVGGLEAPITPLTLAGFESMGALAATGAYPFDRQREGFVLAEGGAVFVLETADLAAVRSAKVYGRVLDFGATVDAHHLSAPAPDRGAARAALAQCLKRSRLSPHQLGYIHAHGTATQLNDQAEAQLLQAAFPAGIAVSSTKGATGHTLGASGALGVAFTLLALHQGILPPCVGLRQPAFDLDLVRTPRFHSLESALCFSFGFGGQNAVLALGAQG